VTSEPQARTDGTTTAAQALPPEEVCKVCRKPIPAGAVKCVACGSYQDWRRFLLSWTALISAVVGVLIAVVAFLSPVYQYLFPPQVAPAQLAISFERCLSDSIAMLTTNNGGQTAVVERPTFDIFADGRWQRMNMTGLWDRGEDPFQEDNDREVLPKQTDSQIYPNDLRGFFVNDPVPRGCKIRATVGIRQGAAEGVTEVSGECPCGFGAP
jgi:predicted nucleic acid-binding Zn ribbon protein